MPLMRIAVPDFVSSTMFPLVVAKELGIFGDEGVDVEIELIPGLAAVKSLRDGAVDFSAGPAHAPVMIFPGWRGVKLVATVSQGTPWMLVMRAGLAKRGEILKVKGHRIAVDKGPGLVFKYLLSEAGIDVERDEVQIVPPPSNDPGISFGVVAGRALVEEKVDGLWVNVLGCEIAVHLDAGSIVIDPRRGDGPSGSGNYSFAALATTEANIENNRKSIEAVIRAVARAQSEIRRNPQAIAEVALRSFPQLEAELMRGILVRDAQFYRPSISMRAIEEMNRFITAVGLLPNPVTYDQVIATEFRHLWSTST
jgi:NitT/TauT family transport system substrate-binding protein